MKSSYSHLIFHIFCGLYPIRSTTRIQNWVLQAVLLSLKKEVLSIALTPARLSMSQYQASKALYDLYFYTK